MRTAEPCMRHSANSQRSSKPPKENPPFFLFPSRFRLPTYSRLSLSFSFPCLGLFGNACRFRATENPIGDTFRRRRVTLATGPCARSTRGKRRTPDTTLRHGTTLSRFRSLALRATGLSIAAVNVFGLKSAEGVFARTASG